MTAANIQNQRKNQASTIKPDANAPPLAAWWYHAVDAPLVDPVSLRQEKATRSASVSSSSITETTTSTTTTTQVKSKVSPKNWVAFSGRDSAAIEKAYQVI
ncbi:hypothetical protein BC941DRAFT_173058 [Chlamydoabsidia padenii]|nr:hypothetical protein BC941DRAFT_173058 [Chlamydoabsidia padenii]